jgi:hypothetical protein
MDNSPIDIAIQAGATHIVSFELDPILNYNTPANTQAKPRTMIDVYTDSFSALMTRVMNIMIVNRCQANAANPASPIPIYRLGPITQYFTLQIPGPISHGPQVTTGPIPPFSTLNFNGLWQQTDPAKDGFLLINLEDRFMQGYQDARLLSPPTSPPPPGFLATIPAGCSSVVSPNLGAPAMNDPVFKDYLNRAAATPGAPTGRVSWAKANMAWMALTKPSPQPCCSRARGYVWRAA